VIQLLLGSRCCEWNIGNVWRSTQDRSPLSDPMGHDAVDAPGVCSVWGRGGLGVSSALRITVGMCLTHRTGGAALRATEASFPRTRKVPA